MSQSKRMSKELGKRRILLSIVDFHIQLFFNITMSTDARQKNYKHRGLDSEELRKRREDLNITLRKQKREEQVISMHFIFFHHFDY